MNISVTNDKADLCCFILHMGNLLQDWHPIENLQMISYIIVQSHSSPGFIYNLFGMVTVLFI